MFAMDEKRKLPAGKVQANWLIDAGLKEWIDDEAAKRSLRPAYVIEECIEAMRGTTKEVKG